MTLLAACSETTTSPRLAAPRGPSSSAPSFDFAATSYSLGSLQSDLVVGAAGGSFILGGYTINFPANSVCDPARSTYGSTEWDKPCVTLDPGQTIAIHATLALTSSGLAVDFSPALRFSPSTQVTISTDIFASTIKANKDYFANNPGVLSSLAILYAPSLGTVGTSDYAKDNSIVTHVDLDSGRIWRRVKHFSGYSIVTGEACEPAPDNPDCVQVDGH